MKIVLLESLGVRPELVASHAEKLRAMGHEFVEYPKDTDERVQLERARGADVLMLANMPLHRSVVTETKGLKFVDVAFTGVDHIPVAEAKELGIAVSNASGYADDSVAELCLGFMIGLLRKIREQERSLRDGGTKLSGNLLKGKTVGIVGCGRIGRMTARLCKAFGCRLLANDCSEVTDPVFDRQVDLETLLSESDIVSLHCPLTEETQGLIDGKALKIMKKTAFLINTARGPVVDEKALARALEEGEIAGAALDVFEKEPPLPKDYPLFGAPNCILSPHMAFASVEAMERRLEIVFDNLYAFLEGRRLNVVC